MNKRLSLLVIFVSFFLVWVPHAKAAAEENEEVFKVREADFLQAVNKMNMAQKDRQELQNKVRQITLEGDNFYRQLSLYKELSQTLEKRAGALQKSLNSAKSLEKDDLSFEDQSKTENLLEQKKLESEPIALFESSRDGMETLSSHEANSEKNMDILAALSQRDQEIETLKAKISTLETERNHNVNEKRDAYTMMDKSPNSGDVSIQTENIGASAKGAKEISLGEDTPLSLSHASVQTKPIDPESIFIRGVRAIRETIEKASEMVSEFIVPQETSDQGIEAFPFVVHQEVQTEDATDVGTEKIHSQKSLHSEEYYKQLIDKQQKDYQKAMFNFKSAQEEKEKSFNEQKAELIKGRKIVENQAEKILADKDHQLSLATKANADRDQALEKVTLTLQKAREQYAEKEKEFHSQRVALEEKIKGEEDRHIQILTAKDKQIMAANDQLIQSTQHLKDKGKEVAALQENLVTLTTKKKDLIKRYTEQEAEIKEQIKLMQQKFTLAQAKLQQDFDDKAMEIEDKHRKTLLEKDAEFAQNNLQYEDKLAKVQKETQLQEEQQQKAIGHLRRKLFEMNKKHVKALKEKKDQLAQVQKIAQSKDNQQEKIKILFDDAMAHLNNEHEEDIGKENAKIESLRSSPHHKKNQLSLKDEFKKLGHGDDVEDFIYQSGYHSDGGVHDSDNERNSFYESSPVRITKRQFFPASKGFPFLAPEKSLARQEDDNDDEFRRASLDSENRQNLLAFDLVKRISLNDSLESDGLMEQNKFNSTKDFYEKEIEKNEKYHQERHKRLKEIFEEYQQYTQKNIGQKAKEAEQYSLSLNEEIRKVDLLLQKKDGLLKTIGNYKEHIRQDKLRLQENQDTYDSLFNEYQITLKNNNFLKEENRKLTMNYNQNNIDLQELEKTAQEYYTRCKKLEQENDVLKDHKDQDELLKNALNIDNLQKENKRLKEAMEELEQQAKQSIATRDRQLQEIKKERDEFELKHVKNLEMLKKAEEDNDSLLLQNRKKSLFSGSPNKKENKDNNSPIVKKSSDYGTTKHKSGILLERDNIPLTTKTKGNSWGKNLKDRFAQGSIYSKYTKDIDERL